ncbi:MAG: phosphoenolpyruvate--protein phosphotransferase [Pirellulales bacterium]|nr:phosphoenolpyruvate--protein phosphotransferase [Pirellulales bacterium]
MRKGIAVSPGVAVGIAYCVDDIYVRDREPLARSQIYEELKRYDEGCEKTALDLHALHQKVATQVGQSEAAIFQMHETILRDPAFTGKVRNWIAKEAMSAPAALRRLLAEYTNLFRRTEDEYLRERLTDVRDVILRLSAHVSEALRPDSKELAGPVVLIANELLPSHAVTLGDHEVVGIVTQTGGRTSHAAILARGRGVPAVSGVRGVLRALRNGDTVVVDGRDGHVIINPDSETASAYRKLQREFVNLKHHLAANREKPAISADGQPVDLLANVNHVLDATSAVQMGAAGVGLFRTEYLFLTHADVPDEEEQYQAYRQVINAAPQRRVTIRTLDLGGDKTIPYLGHSREANPFLGWRSIRLSFEHPDFFSKQLRAILRAAAPENGESQDVRIMFPMITTLEEMRRVRGMVRRARRALESEGKPAGELPIGLMIEVPAAAICIESLLEVVDFVSIGTNDLVQYLMAADRDNPKVNHLCQPLSPAVLRVLHDVIRACDRVGKPVTLCGEMAGNPRAFLLLHGMGLRSFSMSPAFISTIKDLVGRLTRSQTSEILRHALTLKTSGQIVRYTGQQLAKIAPELTSWDSG